MAIPLESSADDNSTPNTSPVNKAANDEALGGVGSTRPAQDSDVPDPQVVAALKTLQQQDTARFETLYKLARSGHTISVRAFIEKYKLDIKDLEKSGAAGVKYPALPFPVADSLVMKEIQDLKELVETCNPSQDNFLRNMHKEAERRKGLTSEVQALAAADNVLPQEQKTPVAVAAATEKVAPTEAQAPAVVSVAPPQEPTPPVTAVKAATVNKGTDDSWGADPDQLWDAKSLQEDTEYLKAAYETIIASHEATDSSDKLIRSFRKALFIRLKESVKEQNRLKELDAGDTPTHLKDYIKFVRSSFIAIDEKISSTQSATHARAGEKPPLAQSTQGSTNPSATARPRLANFDDFPSDPNYKPSWFERVRRAFVEYLPPNTTIGKRWRFENTQKFEMKAARDLDNAKGAESLRRVLDRLEARAFDVTMKQSSFWREGLGRKIPSHLIQHEKNIEEKLLQFRKVYEKIKPTEEKTSPSRSSSWIKRGLVTTAGGLLVALGLGLGMGDLGQKWQNYVDGLSDSNPIKLSQILKKQTLKNFEVAQRDAAAKDESGAGAGTGSNATKAAAGSVTSSTANGAAAQSLSITTPSGVVSLDWAAQQPGADAKKLATTAEPTAKSVTKTPTVKASSNFGNVAYSTLDTPIVETAHEEGKFESRFGNDTYKNAMAYVNAQQALFPNMK